MVRLLKIVTAVLVSLLALFLIGSIIAAWPNWHYMLDDINESATYLHRFLPIPLLALTIVVAVCWTLDRFGVRMVWVHIVVWAVPLGITSRGDPSVIALCALSGFIYWALVGRFAGLPEVRLADYPKIRIITYVLLSGAAIYLVIGLSWWVAFGGKLLWVTMFDPLKDRATTDAEFGADLEHVTRAALWDFPDYTACFGDTDSPPEFTEIDWSQIETNENTEICLFHLFASFRDIEDAAAWAETQDLGFYTWSHGDVLFGDLMLSDVSLNETGPDFPTDRLDPFPFLGNLTVLTHWNAEGTVLRSVRAGYFKG